jgi:hypothetical protein
MTTETTRRTMLMSLVVGLLPWPFVMIISADTGKIVHITNAAKA